MTHITAEQAQALLDAITGIESDIADFDGDRRGHYHALEFAEDALKERAFELAHALIASEAARKLAERRLDKAVWALEPFANWAAYLGKDGPDNRRLSAHGAGLAYGDVRNAARITKEITE